MSELSGKSAEKTVRRTRRTVKTSTAEPNESGPINTQPAEEAGAPAKAVRSPRSKRVSEEAAGSPVPSANEPAAIKPVTTRKRTTKADKDEAPATVKAPARSRAVSTASQPVVASDADTPVVKKTRTIRKPVMATHATDEAVTHVAAESEFAPRSVLKPRKPVSVESAGSAATVDSALQIPEKVVSRRSRIVRKPGETGGKAQSSGFSAPELPVQPGAQSFAPVGGQREKRGYETRETRREPRKNDSGFRADYPKKRRPPTQPALSPKPPVFFDDEGDIDGNIAPERQVRSGYSGGQKNSGGQPPLPADMPNRSRRAPRNPQHGRRHEERRVTRDQSSSEPRPEPLPYTPNNAQGRKQANDKTFESRPLRTPRSPLGRGRAMKGERNERGGRGPFSRNESAIPTEADRQPMEIEAQEGFDGNTPLLLGRPVPARAGKKPPRAAPDRRPQAGSEEEKPERLHKLLAEAGVGSRREMEEWIIAGRVTVNAMPAHVGQLVQPGDRIRVNGKLIDLKKASSRQARVLLYHKPEGQIVSRDDPQNRESVFDALPRLRSGRWIAVGRLDYNTSGLLLFTTSGDLANRLTHPSANLVREYAVRILGDISDESKHQLLDGIELEDGPARFTTLEEAGGEGANRWLNVTIYEGRNREVRRMFESVGVIISRLMRVRYGPFILPPYLKRGQVRELEVTEVETLLNQFGITSRAWGSGSSRAHVRSKPVRAAKSPVFEGNTDTGRKFNRPGGKSKTPGKGTKALDGGRGSSNLLGSGRRRRNKPARV